MKNPHENVPEIDQEQYQRLCAYVFGELTRNERVDFEIELGRSPALRAERERLEATVGLVKAAVPDEGLSEAVRADLLAVARRRRFRFLGGRRLMSLAAAVVLIAGVGLALRFLGGGGPSVLDVADNGRVAKAPGDVAMRESSGLKAEAALEKSAEAEVRSSRGGKDELAAAAPSRMKAQEPPSEVQADGHALEQLRALGYGGDDGGDADVARFRAGLEAKRMNEPAPTAEYARAEADPNVAPQASALLPPGPTSPGLSGAPSVAVTRSGEPRGRFGDRAGARDESAERAQALILGAGEARQYRGPGDSAPTPTVNTITHELPSSGSEGFFLGQGQTGERWKAKENSEALRRLSFDFSTSGLGEDENRDRELLSSLGYLGEAEEQAEEPGVDSVAFELDLEDDVEVSGIADAPTQAGRVVVQPRITREQLGRRYDELLAIADLRPGERPRDMFFRYWGDSPFVLAREEHTSTFAVDVDTASYALTRAYLDRGQLPPREAVRTEELVNYFRPDCPAPTGGDAFALGLDLAPSPFSADPRAEMLRVTVRAADVPESERRPVALTFVIDNSGSMQGERSELVKNALVLLLNRLDAADTVAIVKFSNTAAVVTPPLPVSGRGALETLIRELPIEGGTNVEAGLRTGYELAVEHLRPDAINRVVLCSDGVGNIGETRAAELLALVKDARAKGLYLNTVGVGMGNHDDAFLEELANKGDGVCNYVDGEKEARRVFVDGLTSALVPVARDVKIQVELDPARVESWRLLGYENRALRNRDFRDDAVDAGEVNAGHQVTALYEVVRLPAPAGPLATVRLRYKPPFMTDPDMMDQLGRLEPDRAREIERTLSTEDALPGFAGAPDGFQRAVLVAQFAEVLRQSVHARGDSLAVLLREARRLERTLGDPDFTEFVELLGKANPLLDERAALEPPRVQILLDRLSELHYETALRARKRELAAQAGEPEPSSETKAAEQAAEAAAAAEIARLRGELLVELGQANGFDREALEREALERQALEKLKELGYTNDER